MRNFEYYTTSTTFTFFTSFLFYNHKRRAVIINNTGFTYANYKAHSNMPLRRSRRLNGCNARNHTLNNQKKQLAKRAQVKLSTSSKRTQNNDADNVGEVTPVLRPSSLQREQNRANKLVPGSNEEDEITPVTSEGLWSADKNKTAIVPTYDDLDEITPVYKHPPARKPRTEDPVEIVARSVLKDKQIDPTLLQEDVPVTENEVNLREESDSDGIQMSPKRVPLRTLQPDMKMGKVTTYGKRPRSKPVEIPSRKTLGLANMSMDDTSENSEEEESEEEHEQEENSSNVKRNKDLDEFMKQQKALWDEVDKVDLLEELD